MTAARPHHRSGSATRWAGVPARQGCPSCPTATGSCSPAPVSSSARDGWRS